MRTSCGCIYRYGVAIAAVAAVSGMTIMLACDTSKSASSGQPPADPASDLAALAVAADPERGGCPTGQDPPGCTFAGSGASIQATPAGVVEAGDEICYRVCYSVPDGGIGSCNVVDFDADLFFPDGTSVVVTTGANIDQGETFCCGGAGDLDPRCNAALTPGPGGDYCYSVDPADEVTSFVGCPPVPSGTDGRVVAYTAGLGCSRTDLGDTVAPCATINNTVAECGDNDVNQECETCDGTDPGVLGCSAEGSGDADACRPGNDTEGCANGSCTCCGDGIINGPAGAEQCDDGGNVAGDGCSATCQIEECDVRVDKQVSCDGVNWFDAGLVFNNDDGTNAPPPCPATDPVFIRYVVANVGDVPVECTLNESNLVIDPDGVVQTGISIGAGVTLPPTDPDGNQNCTDTVTGGEPDTATLNCECIAPSVPLGDRTASDSASITCFTPPECGDDDVNQDCETCDGTDPGTQGCSAAGSGALDECRSGGGGECENGSCTCCGDGEVNGPPGAEQCDDGNDIPGDGCEPDCTPTVGEEVCRTPGYWKVHGCGEAGGLTGCEKRTARNVTQLVINDCGGCLDVCGDIIDSTALGDADSVLEAMCINVSGDPILQLVRQLTAAALNCCVSGGGDACDGISIDAVFDACNTACTSGETTADIGGGSFNCIGAIDCFNNGGTFNQDLAGDCQTGRCWDNSAACSSGDTHLCGGPNPAGPTCVAFAETCHTAEFGFCSDGSVCTEADPDCPTGSCSFNRGPAGSSNACSAANENLCYAIEGDFDAGTEACATGDNGAQSCP